MKRTLLRTGWLTRQMRRRNLSQKELAAKTGISTAYLSLLLNGHRSPGPRVRASLMAALDVAPDDWDQLFREPYRVTR